MKKILGLLVISCLVLSCSKEKTEQSYLYDIIGTWSEISTTEGEYISTTTEVSWTFNIDDTATERLVLKMNDVSFCDELMHFSYHYDGRRTIHFTGNKSSFTYNVAVNGNAMRLGNEEDGYFNLTKQ